MLQHLDQCANDAIHHFTHSLAQEQQEMEIKERALQRAMHHLQSIQEENTLLRGQLSHNSVRERLDAMEREKCKLTAGIQRAQEGLTMQRDELLNARAPRMALEAKCKSMEGEWRQSRRLYILRATRVQLAASQLLLTSESVEVLAGQWREQEEVLRKHQESVGTLRKEVKDAKEELERLEQLWSCCSSSKTKTTTSTTKSNDNITTTTTRTGTTGGGIMMMTMPHTMKRKREENSFQETGSPRSPPPPPSSSSSTSSPPPFIPFQWGSSLGSEKEASSLLKGCRNPSTSSFPPPPPPPLPSSMMKRIMSPQCNSGGTTTTSMPTMGSPTHWNTSSSSCSNLVNANPNHGNNNSNKSSSSSPGLSLLSQAQTFYTTQAQQWKQTLDSLHLQHNAERSKVKMFSQKMEEADTKVRRARDFLEKMLNRLALLKKRKQRRYFDSISGGEGGRSNDDDDHRKEMEDENEEEEEEEKEQNVSPDGENKKTKKKGENREKDRGGSHTRSEPPPPPHPHPSPSFPSSLLHHHHHEEEEEEEEEEDGFRGYTSLTCTRCHRDILTAFTSVCFHSQGTADGQ